MRMRGEVQHQLKMFMTGPEIQQTYGANPAEIEGETEAGMWKRKVAEASYAGGRWGGLRQSIQKEGVRAPVEVWHGGSRRGGSMLLEGHHRVAVSAVDKPQSYLPIEHYDERSNWFS